MLTLSLLTDSHGPPFVSFFIKHPHTIFIHWNIFKNKQEVAALKLKQHFNNDRQCNIWKSSVRNVQGLKQSSRFHGPTRHLDYFFLLLLFSFFTWAWIFFREHIGEGIGSLFTVETWLNCTIKIEKCVSVKIMAVLNHSHFLTNTRK